ncbi:MAG: hypothetical protein HOB52_03750 [Euryarchaeota archaeon]|nr:hypothetical protein [Euryarchaeota archaeon]
MGGLLDKANLADNNDDEQATDAEGEAKIEPEATGGLLAKSGAEGEWDNPSSGVSIRVDRYPGDDDTPAWLKYGSVVGVLLLIGFIAYQLMLGFNMGGYSITLTEIEIDENDNALRFQIAVGTPMFGSVDGTEVNLSISYGEDEVWTGVTTIDRSINWIEVPFADFYQGNSRDSTGFNNHIYYTITATQGSSSDELRISPPQQMDRTLSAADSEYIEMKENGECDGDTDTVDLCHIGLWFRVGVGIDDPINDGLLWHIDSDYTIDAVVKYNGNPVLTFPPIAVDGAKSSWSSSGEVNEGGTMVENAWMGMGGTKSVPDVAEGTYVERDNFFVDDGCYSLTVTVTHNTIFGGSYSVDTEGIHLYWDENENRGNDDPYEPSVACEE